jgi:hypothetical protein
MTRLIAQEDFIETVTPSPENSTHMMNGQYIRLSQL